MLTDVKIHKMVKGSPGAQHALVSFKGPASYTQYGETVYARNFGLVWFWGATTAIGYNASGQGLWKADLYMPNGRGAGQDDGKVIVTDMADGEEAAATTDLSAITFQMVVHGA